MRLVIINKLVLGTALGCLWSVKADACTVARSPYDTRTAAAIAIGTVQSVGSERPYPQYKVRRQSVVVAPTGGSIAQTIVIKPTFVDIGMCGSSPALRRGDDVIVYFGWLEGRLKPILWRFLHPTWQRP